MMIWWFKKIVFLIILVPLLMLFTALTSPYLWASESKLESVSYAKHHILAIVSDRSSASLVAGAHHYLSQLKHNANTSIKASKISIRSVSQINQLDNQALQSLLGSHQSILFAGVFGEPVERLLSSRYSHNQTRIIVNSDRRLMPLHQDRLNANFADLSKQQQNKLMKALEKNNYIKALKKQQQAWPQFKLWLQARAYWQNRGKENISHLFTWLSMEYYANSNEQLQLLKPAIEPLKAIRYYLNETLISSEHLKIALEGIVPPIQPDQKNKANNKQGILFIVDHDTGDQVSQWSLHQLLCQAQWQCVSVLAGWGKASEQAIQNISELQLKTSFAIVALQDFVIGGGGGRNKVTDAFSKMNVPVFKGIRVNELSSQQYRISAQGLPSDSVHYRVAMPELQGTSQAHLLALASKPKQDPLTGAVITLNQNLPEEVARLKKRITAWFKLRRLNNADKKVAIIYYNHPPGRHNIGADNLNVQSSLWHILQNLKAEGYNLGPESKFPKTEAALLDVLQTKAVNLPQDAGALATMAGLVKTMPASQYRQYFSKLPVQIQAEMSEGPLGHLHQQVAHYIREPKKGGFDGSHLSVTERNTILNTLLVYVDNTIADLHHAIDGIRHQGRQRALDLLSQVHSHYQAMIQAKINGQGEISDKHWQHASQLKQAIIDMHIEGIRGWGKAPGQTMVWHNALLLPGVQFGNIFLGPQPPRGWELNEELLHANMTFPPPHQYLAFYHYLADEFKANALIHLGRHSTYEFLPKRAVGLSASDYPSLIIGHIPSIYPYIVDGVGEGIQAKRRGLAVMLDHLTPPLATTDLYDGLLQLRQLIESAEAALNPQTKQKAIKALRHKIAVLNLEEELIASMDEELQVRGIGFSDVDDDFLLHEVGHYLTHLQEDFMPLGLHVFGQDWQSDAINTMLTSIEKGELDFDDAKRAQIKQALNISPKHEMRALLNALDGGFVKPGKGNDPIRTPDALPTGRNFYALDGSLIPSQLGFSIGQKLAKKARSENPVVENHHKEAVILWASDAVRDEGAMIAFGFDMLGVKPVWNKRGILKSLALQTLTENKPVLVSIEHTDKVSTQIKPQRHERRDVVFTTSGLFRDLYAQQLVWLDRAVLLALAASKATIDRDHPALSSMLQAALAPIDGLLSTQEHAFNEPLSRNHVASNWLKEAQALLQISPLADKKMLARQASYRIFGTAPGSYGAGINRLAERSGAWSERKQLADAYIKRMSHAYGIVGDGISDASIKNAAVGKNVNALFRQQLSHVKHTYLGRASNLYGLIDNNDAYDYLGGLNLAIETIQGQAPQSFVIAHANNKNLSIEPLKTAILSELRGRFLNRQWIEPLMKEGYAGARTMGSEFIENLWGWQATSPDIIKNWVWQDVKSVYIDDSLELGLDDFLNEKHKVHVQSNILAIMLVAMQKGFWQSDEQTQTQLATQFAQNIVEHGLPGSGHTHANHPVYDFIKPIIGPDLVKQVNAVLAAANHQANKPLDSSYERVQEVSMASLEQAREAPLKSQHLEPSEQENKKSEPEEKSKQTQTPSTLLYGLFIGIVILLLAGLVRSRIQAQSLKTGD